MTVTEEVRKKFEEWATSGNYSDMPLNLTRLESGHYIDCNTHDCWTAFEAAYHLGVQDGLEQAANAMEGAAYSLPTKPGWTSTPANYLLKIRDALLELKEGNAKAERG